MITKTKLTNGLTLLVAPQHETKAVTVLILLPVGSRYEGADVNGVSHFIEHLMFKGTKKRPTSLDLTKELDAVGAEYNAFTGKDYTGYYIKVAADKIELAFDILSDMLLNATFKDEEIQKERGVIVEEINMYEDNPLMYVDNIYENEVYAGHPLGQLIIGPREVIKTVPRKKIIAYRDRFYAPSNMTMTVAGKCDIASVKQLAKKYFGGKEKPITRRTAKKFRITQKAPRVGLMYKETEQVQLCLGFPSYGLADERINALYLLAIILGGNMSSRLFVSVREKHGLAYFIKAGAEAYQDVGSFVVQAGLDRSRIEQAIRLILSELVKIRDEGVTDHELQTAKDFLKGKLALGLEDSEQVADWYGKQQLLLGTLLTPEQRIKRLYAVTQKDVRVAARDIIKQHRLNLAVIGPYKDKRYFERLLVLENQE